MCRITDLNICEKNLTEKADTKSTEKINGCVDIRQDYTSSILIYLTF